MNQDELAFFNQQLAGMLHDGIPLEGAVRQLCRDLRAGSFRTEMEALAADLSHGLPVKEAVGRRRLPEVYKRLLQAGAASGDLPGALTLLADHYEEGHTLTSRVKGVLVYPLIVLLVMLGISIVLAFVCRNAARSDFLQGGIVPPELAARMTAAAWVTPVLLLLLAAALVAAIAIPALRNRLRWQMPGFRDASLSRLSATFALMLRRGVPLPDAIDLARQLEHGSPAQMELRAWSERLAAGTRRFGEVAAPTGRTRVFPPLFRWLVTGAGPDLAAGFGRAASFYAARARHRFDLLLYGLLPIAMIILGFLTMGQLAFMFQMLIRMIDALGSDGGGGS